jgi:hypothetical protein
MKKDIGVASAPLKSPFAQDWNAICLQSLEGWWRKRYAGRAKAVNGPMKILILVALFGAIAAACYRAERQEEPKPAA